MLKDVMKTLIAMVIYAGAVAGQEIPERTWENSIVGSVNMTQTGFDNWAAGGENAFAWQVNVNFKFVQLLEKTTWSNSGKIVYGATKIGNADLQKSVDEIKMESVLIYKGGSSINPFIAFTGETQLAAGYNYGTDPALPISAFMDPGYFRESLGAGMELRKDLTTRLGLSFKQTVTTDYPVPYADDIETLEIETLRSEIGIESVTDMLINISETSNYVSKLELFSAFRTLDEIDVGWDNTLTVKVSEYINMNVNLKLVYDKDVSPKRQLKQSMALGLNYTFL
ncbi:MAG: DUF3078 domain-containing protein [Candidatus Marinimicrobia bacterium]|nr:DUF3078 domain-containing protein [Candidatus Neomarinimicrobiota bacterium]